MDPRAARWLTGVRRYLLDSLIAFDMFVNVLTGGTWDQTISSRVQYVSSEHHSWRRLWRSPGILIAKLLLGGLDWIQRNHGALAEAGDTVRAEAIVTLYRTRG